jgi:hypothetical protein
MSFKAIDLQFAVHKNDEAGLKQNQLSHKPQQDQAVLENQMGLSAERERQRSQKVEQGLSNGIHQEHQKNGKQQDRRRSNPPKASPSSSAANHADHPFKGHHIDLSL